MGEKLLAINLFGACTVRSLDVPAFEITGAKHKALFALLATAPFGRRTRGFLQETLWGAADYETGRQSLRRALADIKQIMGPAFGELIASSHAELTLDLSRVQFLGRPRQGEFLEGLEVRTPGFLRWRESVRENPSQLDALFSLSHQPPALPILPVIAVIPFRALSGGPDQALLGDWLAEEICRSLSRSHLLTVISHLSCREFAQTVVETSSVREKLSAAYCVTGSLRATGDEIVLDADFIDVQSGRLLWTRQFAGPAAEFSARWPQGIHSIVQAVGRTIADESLAHVAGRELHDIEDHRLIVAGVGLMHRLALRDFARSRVLLDEAIRRSPNTPETHAWLAKWYILSVFNHWSIDEAGDARKSLDCTARALDLSPGNSFCLTIDGFAQNNLLKRLDIASQRYEAALENNPNESLSWLLKGTLLAFQDDGAGAVEASALARRLSPIDPFGYFYDALSAGAYLALEDYAQALQLIDRSLATNDRHISSLRIRIAALHHLGQGEAARACAALLMQRQPQFSIEAYKRAHPAAAFATGQRVIEALKASGIQ